MYINAQLILIFLFVNAFYSQKIQKKLVEETQAETKQTQVKNKCKCLHNGECYYQTVEELPSKITKKQYCRCTSPFIGGNCSIQGNQLNANKKISQTINIHDYKYFYYEPTEENMYSFSFELCLDPNYEVIESQHLQTQTSMTFFLALESEDGEFEQSEQLLNPTTILVEKGECQYVSIDYTVLMVTKIKGVQKLILGIKLGDRVTPRILKQENNKLSEEQSSFKTTTKNLKNPDSHAQQTFKNETQVKNKTQVKEKKVTSFYHPVSYSVISQKNAIIQIEPEVNGIHQNIKNINQMAAKTKTPSKIKQNGDLYLSRTVFLNFLIYPFVAQIIVFNILFSLTTLTAFIIVGIMIFIIRSRILGIRITRTLAMRSKLINDITHFDLYICTQKYLKKEKKPGDESPNSSQNQCAICLVKFQNLDSVRRTPCAHIFHQECIDKWCHQNLTCPFCRRSLTKKNMEEFYQSTQLELKNSPESDQ